MKVCMISGSYPPDRCGVGDQLQQLSGYLSKHDIAVSVITSQNQVKTRTDQGVDTYAILPDWTLLTSPALYSMIAKLQPDICHLQYPSLGYARGLAPNFLFAWLRWRLPKIKCVITIHEYEMYTWAGRLRLHPALLAAHKIICTNQLDRDKLVGASASYAQKVQIIPLGSNIVQKAENNSRQGKAKKKTERKQRWVLHFGTVMPNKGWESLLLALKRLNEKAFPVNVLVAGELNVKKYDYHQKVAALIQNYGLEDQIHFTGYLLPEAVSEVLTRYPVAVQPYTDGAKLNRSSLVALLTHHRAVVTVDPRIQLEKLKHGQHFWGVLPNDPTSLADGIHYVLSNPDIIERLQMKAKQVSDYFSWDSIINKYRAVYQQLLNT